MRRARVDRRVRPGVMRLEAREALAVDFNMALGLGVLGNIVDLKADAVAQDAAGDLVVVGSIIGSADFDPGPGTTNLASTGQRDAFVAEYTPGGALKWAETFAGQSSTSVGEADAVAVDGSGNIELAGSFSGSVRFGGGAGSVTLAAPSRTDVYAAKLDGSGHLLWAVASSGQTYDVDSAGAIAPDGSGGVYLAGSYMDVAHFGATTLTAGGLSEAFAAHVNAAGQFTWAKSTIGSGASSAGVYGLAVDPSGRLATAGYYSGTVDFDPAHGPASLTAIGSRDAAVWVLDGSGNLAWARGVGGADFDQADSVAVDPSGDVYVTGAFSGTVDFNPRGSPARLTATGQSDVFVLKLSPSGSYAWAGSFAGSTGATSRGQGIGVDGQGRVVVDGWFAGTAEFDPSGFAPPLTSAGAEDVFVAVLDSQGDYLGARAAGGSGSDMALGLSVNASGSIALAGTYTGPAGFESITLRANGKTSIFVASMAQSTVVLPTPVAPSLEAASNTGGSSANLTSATAPVFDVVATSAGLTVQLFRDGTPVGRRSGSGAIADPGRVPDGIHLYTARQVDNLGDYGPASPSTSVTVDTIPPAAPAGLGLLASDDSGAKGDGITNVGQPRLTGTAEADATVQILDATGKVVASGPASSTTGAFAIGLPAPLSDGTYSYSARAIDQAGNVGPAGGTFSLQILATPPAAPSILTLLPADDSGAKGDEITDVTRPRLTGTAAAGSAVTLLDASGDVLGTATAGAGGAFTVQPSAPLAQGPASLRATATDAAGNVGAAGPALTITILTMPPPAPTALTLVPADDSGKQGDGITDVTRPHVSGTAAANATVSLIGPKGVLGTAVASGAGAFTVAPTAGLADGPIALEAQATDVAGNVGPVGPSITITILTARPPTPATPSLLPLDDSGSKGDGITDVATPRLVGTATAGDAVELLDSSGNVLGTSTADASTGAYTVAPLNRLPEGADGLSVAAVDVAGNASLPSPPLVLTIDTTPPAPPSVLTLLAADDSGVGGDGITNVTRPRLTGTALAGSLVTLLDGSGNVLGTATAAADGSFTVQPSSPMADGPAMLRASATDAAGNVGVAGPALTITILATPPAPPSIGLLPADDTGIKGDGITKVRRPRLTGVAAPGARVDLMDGMGDVLASTTADPATGAYTLAAPATTAGTFSYEVRATDVAGNVGAVGSPITIRILATPGDFDGDGSADVATFNPATGVWSIRSSSTGSVTTRAFGWAGVDVPEPADYDGDGKTDVAVYRPTTGEWFILNSSTGTVRHVTFGWAGVDVPVPGDYDGDGKADVAVYRPTTGQWFILNSKTGVTTVKAFGWANNDVPVPGDYDGDGKTDVAVYRPSNSGWYISRSTDGATVSKVFGWAGHDRPVPADYDGDGFADVAVFRPGVAGWYIAQSSTGTTRSVTYGWAGLDEPLPYDYNGDGKVDLTVFRPTSSTFYIQSSIDGSQQVVQLGQTNVARPALMPMTYQLVGLALAPGGASSADASGPTRSIPGLSTSRRVAPGRSVLVESPRVRYPG